MSLVEQYPHPGEAPVKDPAPESERGNRLAYGVWTKMLRQHVVARAVDALTVLAESGTVVLTPEQEIAAVLGTAYLEDRLSSQGGIFAGLF